MPTRQAGGFRKRPITHIGCVGDPTPLICPPEVFLLVEEGDVSECGEGRATYSFTITNAGSDIIAGNALALTWLLNGDPLALLATNPTFTEDTAFTTIEGDGTQLNVTDTWAAGQTVTVTVTIDNTDCEDLQIITLSAIGSPPLSEINQADNTAESTFLPLGLRLTFTPGNLPANDLAAWNTLFDLPANGTAFNALSQNADEVTLVGGAGITLKASLFRNSATLLKIEDDVDCVVAIAGGKNLGALSLCSALTTVVLDGVITVAQEGLFTNVALTSLSMDALTTAGANAFNSCTSLVTIVLPALTTAGAGAFASLTSATTFTLLLLNSAGVTCFSYCTDVITFSLPALTTAGSSCFDNCTSATTFTLPLCATIGNSCFAICTSATSFNLSSCTDLGGTAGDDFVFNSIAGNLVTVTIPIAQQTIDGGNPDGDLVYLAANNTATINYI